MLETFTIRPAHRWRIGAGNALRPGLLVGDRLRGPKYQDPGGVDQDVQPIPAGFCHDLVAGVVD